MFCLYRYKIAYYLSHTGKDKKIFILMSLKVLIYNMLLGYCTLMLGIVRILYAYITFKFTKSELFFLKMSLPLLLIFFLNGPYIVSNIQIYPMHQGGDAEPPMVYWDWSTMCDAGPIIRHHFLNVWFLLP